MRLFPFQAKMKGYPTVETLASPLEQFPQIPLPGLQVTVPIETIHTDTGCAITGTVLFAAHSPIIGRPHSAAIAGTTGIDTGPQRKTATARVSGGPGGRSQDPQLHFPWSRHCPENLVHNLVHTQINPGHTPSHSCITSERLEARINIGSIVLGSSPSQTVPIPLVYALQAGGRRFDPGHVHQICFFFIGLAASDLGSEIVLDGLNP
jgi:hypothetical protein